VTISASDEGRLGVVRRVPFDPKMLRHMSAKAWAEQGPTPLAAWGGSSGYSKLARLPVADRLTYAAVLDGCASTADIADATGLDLKAVESAIADLEKQGYVTASEDVMLET
jgi:hypothetical protein